VIAAAARPAGAMTAIDGRHGGEQTITKQT